MNLSPLSQRRLQQFRANKRGFWSLWIFLALFLIAIAAPFVANDKPIVLSYDGALYFPTFVNYPETAFGGDFETEAEYRDEIHQFYLDYFAEAQSDLNCLADERRIMSEQVNEILKSYRSFAARYPKS